MLSSGGKSKYGKQRLINEIKERKDIAWPAILKNYNLICIIKKYKNSGQSLEFPLKQIKIYKKIGGK